MSAFYKELRSAVFRSKLNNILLITAASHNNEYADHKNVLMLDLLTGFNKKEAALFSRNFVATDDRAELMIRDLGVRPIDLNFNFNYKDKKSPIPGRTNLTVADINKRSKSFATGIEKHIMDALDIGKDDHAIAGGIATIFDVLSGEVGDKSELEIDKRFMKMMWVPEDSAVAVGDIEAYELALCDAWFRNDLKLGKNGLRIFPADNLVRTVCINIFTEFSRKNAQLFKDGRFLDIGIYFERLFVNDLIFPDGQTTKTLILEQHMIHGDHIAKRNGAPTLLDLSADFQHISSDLAVVATDGFELGKSVSERLSNFAGRATLFECRPGFKAVDFVLMSNDEVFFIQVAFHHKVHGLVSKMLKALSTLEADGERLFPILLKGVSPRKINFVFFSSLPPFRGQGYKPPSSAKAIKGLMKKLSAKSNVFNLYLLDLSANEKVLRLCQMLATKRGLTSPSWDGD